MFSRDTIAAISTPPGHGGIGIIRVSGPDALEAALALFIPFHKTGKQLQPRHIVFGRIVDRNTNAHIDQALLTWFQAPHSYTGEDVVELSCHGSRPVLERVMELLIQAGVRPAEPGEFTMRAVLNGRMDLAQAEAVNRLILAKTLLQAEQAIKNIDGSVSDEVHEAENRLLDVISMMEAAVDFAEEEDTHLVVEDAREKLKRLDTALTELVSSFEKTRLLREGAVVVLAGRSNVGKSSLFNAVLNRERSIVDAQPGTTRDFISETVDIQGIPVTLVDTAGLRSGGGEIEIKGMRRTEEQIGKADLVLLVTEAGADTTEEEAGIIASLRHDDIPVIRVLNKVDLAQAPVQQQEDTVQVSALKQTGLDELTTAVAAKLGRAELGEGRNLVVELRQQQLFVEVAGNVNRALALLQTGEYEEVVLEELNMAMRSLGEITGTQGKKEIYKRIFSNFCIGK